MYNRKGHITIVVRYEKTNNRREQWNFFFDYAGNIICLNTLNNSCIGTFHAEHGIPQSRGGREANTLLHAEANVHKYNIPLCCFSVNDFRLSLTREQLFMMLDYIESRSSDNRFRRNALQLIRQFLTVFQVQVRSIRNPK